MKIRTAVAALAMVVVGSTASAASLYAIYDHPEGALSGTYDYGLRFEAAPGSGASDFWSFEDTSDNSLAMMSVDIAGGTASVSGQMRRNSDDSLWSIEISMTGVTGEPGWGLGGFGADSYTAMLTDGMTTFDILGKANGTGYQWTTAFSDPGGSYDWRLPNITAGWLGSATITEHLYICYDLLEYDEDECYAQSDLELTGTNDFIAMLQPIPLPAAGWLLIAGLGAMGLVRRNK